MACLQQVDESSFGTTRLRIPAPGTRDDDHNPPRITPRHVFDLGIGTDNLLHTVRAYHRKTEGRQPHETRGAL